MNENQTNDMIISYSNYLKTIGSWETLIAEINPKINGCGTIYELGNILNRANEDFAIVDIRNNKITEPHYHPAHFLEIYFMIQGSAVVVVKNQKHLIKNGEFLAIPPLTSHYIIPDKDCVIAVANTPPFHIDHYIPLDSTNLNVGFDLNQFVSLKKKTESRNRP